jgi:hypothetical protein
LPDERYFPDGSGSNSGRLRAGNAYGSTESRPVERHRRRGIEARGEQAFLHAWKTNHSAISPYEGLCFKIRTEVNVAVLKRSGVVAQ